jgi:phage tail-like protein
MPTIINGRSTLETDPIRNFRFLVKFFSHQENRTSGIQPKQFNAAVGFTSVSGLSITTESIPYREGGYNTSVHQVPGQTSFSPITLQRGMVLGTDQHWRWMQSLFQVVQGGAIDETFRCDLEISVIQHPRPDTAASALTPGNPTGADDDYNNAAMKFKVYNAWPTSVAYSDLNAGDNAILVEQLTLVHEGFDMVLANKFGNQKLEFPV